MHLSSISIIRDLKNYLLKNSIEKKTAKIMNILMRSGYDPNQLYVVNPSLESESDAIDTLTSEEVKKVLRFFRIPMSLGYLIHNRSALMKDLLPHLTEIIRKKLLQPISGFPLLIDIDQAKWDFYRRLNGLSPPSQVQLNITNRCVNRCHMCRKYEWPQEDMSIITFREIVKDLKMMGTDLCILSGGEPFLHRHFKEIVDIVQDIPTLTFTSGVVPLSLDTMKKLKRIQFSVDALDPEIYRIVRGPGNVEIVKKNIQKAKEAGCDITVTTVIQKANIFHVPDIMEFCEKENIPFLPSVVHSYDDLSFCSIKKRPLPPLCMVPFYHCLIDPLGDIFVCCHHHEDNTEYGQIDRRYVLGNVLNSRFSEIWYSDKATEIKMWLNKNRAAFCQGCYRYLLENDLASFIYSYEGQMSLPYTHTYIFPLEIMPHLRVPT